MSQEKLTGFVCESRKQTCSNSRGIIVKISKSVLESGCRYQGGIEPLYIYMFVIDCLFTSCLLYLAIDITKLDNRTNRVAKKI